MSYMIKRPCFDALLVNTAWETAKTTGIISEFDYEITENLTRVYSFQDYFSDKTMIKIVDLFFDSETYKTENLETVVFQLMLRTNELTGQELLLEQFYEEAIENLD